MAKYSNKMKDRICGLMRSDSYSICEICKAVGIARDTYYKWLDLYPDFKKATEQAVEDRLDTYYIEASKSLLKKLTGYEVTEEKATYVKQKEGKDKDGNEIINKGILKEKVVTKKHIAPDTIAIMYTMDNRSNGVWKNKQINEFTGVDGKDLIPQPKVDIATLTEEERKVFLAVGEKVLNKKDE